MNEILGLAVIDESFRRDLLNDPLGSVQRRRFVLTEREEAILRSIHTSDFVQFASIVQEQLSADNGNN